MPFAMQINYSVPSNIKVEFYDQKVKITNPRGIYKASLEDILDGVQTFRNPGLVNILNKLEYIEYFGTGIPGIIEAYIQSDKKPEFKVTENYFTLTLPNMNYSEKTALSGLVNDVVTPYTYEDYSVLNRLALNIIIFHPGVSILELQQLVNEYDDSITETMILNSIDTKLGKYAIYKGDEENGGYYLIER